MDRKTFIKSIKSWQATVVKQILIAKPEYADFRDQSDKTPLHHCAEVNPIKSGQSTDDSIKTTAALIDAGADINSVRIIIDEGEEFLARPLWYAVAWGKNLPLVQFLLESGAAPINCMWAACWDENEAMAQLLYAHGAEVDPVFHNETPLLMIVRAKRFKLLAWLIERGANINYQDNNGYSPLYFAVKNNHNLTQIEQLLKYGATPTLIAKDGTSPLSLASEKGKTKLISLLNSYC